MKTRHASSGGLTLFELMVTLAVAAILGLLAAPSFSAMSDRLRVRGWADGVAADLQFARTEAVARHETVRIGFAHGTTGSCYVVHRVVDAPCTCEPDGPEQAGTCASGEPALKTVHLNASARVRLQANVTQMSFDAVHGTVTPAGTLQLAGARGDTVRLIVSAMGRVRKCSPAGATPGYRPC